MVIPTLNRAHFLGEAMDSVLAQTYRPIELIVVNDGCTDNTDAVVEQWAEKCAREREFELRYLHQDAGGGNAARNTGVRKGRGELVAFLDDDDRWSPQKLEKQIPMFLADGEVGAVYCGTRWLNLDIRTRLPYRPRPYPQGWLLPKLLVRDATAPTSAYVVRRVCFDDVGFFDEALPARQDWDMWIRLSEKYKMAATPECLVEQGQHAGERVSTSAPKLVEANKRIFEKYAPLRRRFSFILRLRARAKLCSTLGGVHCDFGHSPVRAVLSHLQGILAWPLRVSNYLGLLRAVMPAKLRRCLDWLTRAAVDCFHRLPSLRSARGDRRP